MSPAAQSWPIRRPHRTTTITYQSSATSFHRTIINEIDRKRARAHRQIDRISVKLRATLMKVNEASESERAKQKKQLDESNEESESFVLTNSLNVLGTVRAQQRSKQKIG